MLVLQVIVKVKLLLLLPLLPHPPRPLIHPADMALLVNASEGFTDSQLKQLEDECKQLEESPEMAQFDKGASTPLCSRALKLTRFQRGLAVNIIFKPQAGKQRVGYQISWKFSLALCKPSSHLLALCCLQVDALYVFV